VQPAVARGPSAEERVLAHLARVNSADRASLARSLNLAELYLRNVLKRLERDNQIVKTADGVFQLAKSLETAGVGGSFQPDSA
jgi:DNA-binding IscR family transcriptional regulator